jgi:hydroxypyruvate reductase
MFQPITMEGGIGVSNPISGILSAAVEAVDPRRAVSAALTSDGRRIAVAGLEMAVPDNGVRILALGKASVAMAWGASDALAGIPLSGVVATPHPAPAPSGLDVVTGAHPSPDRTSVEAGTALMDAARWAGSGDLVLVLVSGGGSACAEVPAGGLSIEHLASASDALLAAGSPIEETNVVRRSLSLLKGGGLAAACQPALVVTLIVSDVVGNDPAVIAGGPTVASPTGPREALAILEDRRLSARCHPAITAYLGDPGPAAPSAPDGPLVIAADVATAAEGARTMARRLGIGAEVADAAVIGEARIVGRRLADTAMGSSPSMAIFGGETTVTVTGDGSGGRNQETVLAAALALEGSEGTVVASMGTDGIDGPTPSAGGVVDGGTVARGKALGLDAHAALDANDSGTYLEGVNGRLVCGPTGTNVGDVMLAWRR